MRRVLLCLVPTLLAQAQSPYQRPPATIQAVLDAPGQPSLLPSPDGRTALLVAQDRNPPLADMARPVAKLAGTRFDPDSRAPFPPQRITALTRIDLASGAREALALPAGARTWQVRWSPDGRHFALLASTSRTTGLWLGRASGGPLRAVPGLRVNPVLGEALAWLPGGSALLAITVPAGPAPAPAVAQAGPRVQVHEGPPAPDPTYQDLLNDGQDAARFEALATAQLVRVEVAQGRTRPIGRPGLITAVAPAPDGRHLLVSLVHRPFSFQVPHDQFPTRHEIWTLDGRVARMLVDQPLAEGIPRQGVRTGPRHLAWKPGRPATLTWIEALDGGDPKAKAPHRDRFMQLAEPFAGEPNEWGRCEHRAVGLQWSPAGDFAILHEQQWERRWLRTWLLAGGKAPALLWERNAADRYGDRGQFLTRVSPEGTRVLQQEGRGLFLSGRGASADGERPFLDAYDLDSGRTERLFRCAEKTYEQPLALLPGRRILTSHETQDQPPVFQLRTGAEVRRLTEPLDPAPAFAAVRKQLVRYQRPDGVALSFTLYLPPDHREGQRHPALVWAYPAEFTDPATAGQVSGSPYRFVRPSGISHQLLTLGGYAILDGATMPVVGDPETVNNTFIEQVVASAKAAIDKAAELGVVDPARVAVGGHSYGAFMTANLLAHCDLFRAGIARSGAYNRTLTPFGFQSERRSLWEAPEMYLKLSPFLKADAFKAPILLMHGEADNNMGTFPIQSERMFQALKGNGKRVRYVTLPYEGHGYIAKESAAHVQWEMVTWLDKHLKGGGVPGQ